jgi:hypothetical protein
MEVDCKFFEWNSQYKCQEYAFAKYPVTAVTQYYDSRYRIYLNIKELFLLIYHLRQENKLLH